MEIRLVAHDPAWAGQFAGEARAIREVIGPWLTGGVEHVGGTAVPGLAARTHHLHLVPTGSPRWRQVLAFRDLLRSDAAAATRYSTLKHSLAARFPDDREAYTDGKSALIDSLVADGFEKSVGPTR